MDAIIIPGGGLNPDGSLPLWTKSRLEKALEIWKGEKIITLSAGTIHKPNPLDSKGRPILECAAAAKYLKVHGVDSSCILQESCSYDTIGNAYFLRTVHTGPAKLRKLTIINSEFHIQRTKRIFDWIFSLDQSEEDSNKSDRYVLKYITVENTGVDKGALSARRNREIQSIKSLNVVIPKIKNMKALHDWLFTEHETYSVGKKPKRASGNVLDSY
ncbi:YdcF family protein [Candidatus Woesearchaeota archaeon]|nr:YdcF family protein [Candidatus Woesearchaeota archaeon]